jgi:hypothetical protein
MFTRAAGPACPNGWVRVDPHTGQGIRVGRPFEYFQQVYLTGSLPEILDKIDQRLDVGVEYLILHTLEPAADQLDVWREHLLPHLAGR